MKLEDQVCSFELAKRLKELGVKHDSLAYYCISDCTKYVSLFIQKFPARKSKHFEVISAFTVAELGDFLRKFEIENSYDLEIDSYNTYDCYNVVVKKNRAEPFESYYSQEDTEANARAKMLIWLIEQGYVKHE